MATDQLEVEAHDNYRWVALTNTTAAVFMCRARRIDRHHLAARDLPRHSSGPARARPTSRYLLWMIMGYRLVQSVLVVTLGRIGDMYGRVRVYNFGFTVFTVASILLSFDPFSGAAAAQWLIGWRLLQAVGGSMLTANSAAILTDAFPRRPAWLRARLQPGGCAGRDSSSAWWPGDCWPHGTGGRCSG